MARKLDRSKSFATISRLNGKPGDPAFSQEGTYFNSAEEECGEVPGFRARQEEQESQAAEQAEAAEKVETADRAAQILGDLGGDPAADAQRENAAAAAAEALSDDAQAEE